MMIGEVTAYFNRCRYVRIEKKNEEEIKREETTLSEIHEDIEKIGKQLKEMKNNSEETW